MIRGFSHTKASSLRKQLTEFIPETYSSTYIVVLNVAGVFLYSVTESPQSSEKSERTSPRYHFPLMCFEKVIALPQFLSRSSNTYEPYQICCGLPPPPLLLHHFLLRWCSFPSHIRRMELWELCLCCGSSVINRDITEFMTSWCHPGEQTHIHWLIFFVCF